MGCLRCLRPWHTKTAPEIEDIEDQPHEDAPETKYHSREELLREIRAGTVRVLRPEFIIDWFYNTDKPLPKRQDIPERAFWDPDELHPKKLEAIALSYCWLSKDHPDPDRYHLETLTRLLELFCRSSYDNVQGDLKLGSVLVSKESLRERQVCFGGGADVQVCVFIDWTGLYQDVPAGTRTPKQTATFWRALKNINLWYAHSSTTVWCFEQLPEGVQRPGYHESGWTVFEQAVAGILTPRDRLLSVTEDLRKQLLLGGSTGEEPSRHYLELVLADEHNPRGVMLAPDHFNKLIDDKTFTNGADKDTVVKPKYYDTFQAVVTNAQSLQLRGIGFRDSDASEVVGLATTHCRNLLEIDLSGNDIRRPIELAMSCPTSVRRLNFTGNGYGSCVAFDVAPLAQLTHLERLELGGTRVSGNLQALAGLTGLEYLWLNRTQVSGDVSVLVGLRKLVRLGLGGTFVSGDVRELALLGDLERLALCNTHVHGDIALFSRSKNLNQLGLGNTKVSGDVGYLESMWSIEVLDLGNTKVHGDVSRLASLSPLKVLALRSTQVGGDVATLSRLLRLERLDLSFTRVHGDSEKLRGLWQLEDINLGRTNVTGDWERFRLANGQDSEDGI
mmetsp:Transcript_110087/g.322026  ORF Transcript_110087/g.322026 Transcript_110087/m.322026 type:complete len:616 (+) Transcript_110087:78-1925(+)